MRYWMILVGVLTAGSATASEFSYDEIALTYRETTIHGVDYLTDQPGYRLAGRWNFAGNWFLSGALLWANNDLRYTYRETWWGAPMPPDYADDYYEYDIRREDDRTYSSLGIGHFWSPMNRLDLTMAGFVHYSHNEYSYDYDVTYIDPRFDPVYTEGPFNETAEDRSHDMGYRVELGLRSRPIGELEVHALAAHSNFYDREQESYHAAVRHPLVARVDAELRYLDLEDGHAWWGSVIYRF